MQQQQRFFQKALVFASLCVSALVFIYALGFVTDLYSLSFHADATSTLFYVEGAELFYAVQPFNKELLRLAIALILLSVLLFATLTHSRRLYYVSNYVSSLLFAGFAGYVGVLNLVNVLYVKQKYLALDFARMQEISDKLKMRFVQSTFMLDAGIVLSCALLLLALCMVVNLIWKTVWMRREKRLMKGE